MTLVGKLVGVAEKEIGGHGFHKAKVNDSLLEGRTEYVLCLYYEDDSRKHELTERNEQGYVVKYRYLKSERVTFKGQYSKDF